MIDYKQIEINLIEAFQRIGWRASKEVGVSCGGRIDVVAESPDGIKYGLEIKSSVSDLHSGYGLNQEAEDFDYGYVICDNNLIELVIGDLYLLGMNRTGVIEVREEGLRIIKPAIHKKIRWLTYPLEML